MMKSFADIKKPTIMALYDVLSLYFGVWKDDVRVDWDKLQSTYKMVIRKIGGSRGDFHIVVPFAHFNFPVLHVTVKNELKDEVKHFIGKGGASIGFVIHHINFEKRSLGEFKLTQKIVFHVDSSECSENILTKKGN